jgi:hypothetical protein
LDVTAKVGTFSALEAEALVLGKFSAPYSDQLFLWQPNAGNLPQSGGANSNKCHIGDLLSVVPLQEEFKSLNLKAAYRTYENLKKPEPHGSVAHTLANHAKKNVGLV